MEPNDIDLHCYWIELSTLIENVIQTLPKKPDAEAPGKFLEGNVHGDARMPLSAAAALIAATVAAANPISRSLRAS